MDRNTWTVERTFFVPMTGLDAANYIMIASHIKIAAHADVSTEHLQLLSDLRSIIAIHRLTFRAVVTNDGSVRKCASREVIERMDDFLQRLDAAGLSLCFRMWSIHYAQELVRMALSEADGLGSDDVADQASQETDRNGCGAIVGFLIVPHSVPVILSEYGHGHREIYVNQQTDWGSLPDELTGS